MKLYYKNNAKVLNQRKIYSGKNKDKLSQTQNNRSLDFTELLKSYVELGNRLKALKENISMNDSEND